MKFMDNRFIISKQLLNCIFKYDRFIIIRFDIIYRIKITEWPKWNEKGLFIVNREKHWLDERLCSDFVFIDDKKSVEDLVVFYILLIFI